jgi:hypothetical protein
MMSMARTSGWLAAVIGAATLVGAASGAEAREGHWKHGPPGHYWGPNYAMVPPGHMRFYGPGPVIYAPPPVAYVTSYPVYAAPVYAAPIYAQPVYAPPVYAAQVTAAPITATPVRAAVVDAAPANPASSNFCTDFILPLP